MTQKKLDNLRVYAYFFLFIVVLLPILFGINISTQWNQVIVVVTVLALVTVAIVEWMRYSHRKAKK